MFSDSKVVCRRQGTRERFPRTKFRDRNSGHRLADTDSEVELRRGSESIKSGELKDKYHERKSQVWVKGELAVDCPERVQDKMKVPLLECHPTNMLSVTGGQQLSRKRVAEKVKWHSSHPRSQGCKAKLASHANTDSTPEVIAPDSDDRDTGEETDTKIKTRGQILDSPRGVETKDTLLTPEADCVSTNVLPDHLGHDTPSRARGREILYATDTWIHGYIDDTENGHSHLAPPISTGIHGPSTKTTHVPVPGKTDNSTSRNSFAILDPGKGNTPLQMGIDFFRYPAQHRQETNQLMELKTEESLRSNLRIHGCNNWSLLRPPWGGMGARSDQFNLCYLPPEKNPGVRNVEGSSIHYLTRNRLLGQVSQNSDESFDQNTPTMDLSGSGLDGTGNSIRKCNQKLDCLDRGPVADDGKGLKYKQSKVSGVRNNCELSLKSREIYSAYSAMIDNTDKDTCSGRKSLDFGGEPDIDSFGVTRTASLSQKLCHDLSSEKMHWSRILPRNDRSSHIHPNKEHRSSLGSVDGVSSLGSENNQIIDKIETSTIYVTKSNIESSIHQIKELLIEYPRVILASEFPGIFCLVASLHVSKRQYNYQLIKTNLELTGDNPILLSLVNDNGQMPSSRIERGGDRIIPSVWHISPSYDHGDDILISSTQRESHSPASSKEQETGGLDRESIRRFFYSSGLVSSAMRWIVHEGDVTIASIQRICTGSSLPQKVDDYDRINKEVFPQIMDVEATLKIRMTIKHTPMECVEISRKLHSDVLLDGRPSDATDGERSSLKWYNSTTNDSGIDEKSQYRNFIGPRLTLMRFAERTKCRLPQKILDLGTPPNDSAPSRIGEESMSIPPPRILKSDDSSRSRQHRVSPSGNDESQLSWNRGQESTPPRGDSRSCLDDSNLFPSHTIGNTESSKNFKEPWPSIVTENSQHQRCYAELVATKGQNPYNNEGLTGSFKNTSYGNKSLIQDTPVISFASDKIKNSIDQSRQSPYVHPWRRRLGVDVPHSNLQVPRNDYRAPDVPMPPYRSYTDTLGHCEQSTDQPLYQWNQHIGMNQSRNSSHNIVNSIHRNTPIQAASHEMYSCMTRDFELPPASNFQPNIYMSSYQGRYKGPPPPLSGMVMCVEDEDNELSDTYNDIKDQTSSQMSNVGFPDHEVKQDSGIDRVSNTHVFLNRPGRLQPSNKGHFSSNFIGSCYSTPPPPPSDATDGLCNTSQEKGITYDGNEGNSSAVYPHQTADQRIGAKCPEQECRLSHARNRETDSITDDQNTDLHRGFSLPNPIHLRGVMIGTPKFFTGDSQRKSLLDYAACSTSDEGGGDHDIRRYV